MSTLLQTPGDPQNHKCDTALTGIHVNMLNLNEVKDIQQKLYDEVMFHQEKLMYKCDRLQKSYAE